MKSLRFMLCVVLLLAACATGEVEVPRGVETAVLPTATATLPSSTNTPTPPTALPTLTPTTEPPPTATPLPTATPMPEPSPTAVPFTQGTLYFVWYPEPKPAPEDMGPGERQAKKLYRAVPGATPDQWTLEPVLTDIRCFCQPKLSPDKTQLAFIQTEDTNQDGYFYSDDDTTIHIYNFAENRVARLDLPNFAQQYGWLSDNEALIYNFDFLSNMGVASTNGSLPVSLNGNPEKIIAGALYQPIREVSSSPNGRLQVLAIHPGIGTETGGLQPFGIIKFVLFDSEQKTDRVLLEAPGVTSLLSWSPDNEWLAVLLTFGTQGLYVANAKTLEAIQLVKSEDLIERVFDPAWSYQGEWLAFIQDKAMLQTWNRTSNAVNHLTSENFIGGPAWATNEDTLAVSFTADRGGGILLMQPAEGTQLELPLSVTPTDAPIWTPDDQWLLFPATAGETSGYYLIHRQGGDVYPVFDTTGLYEPTDFFWLSD